MPTSPIGRMVARRLAASVVMLLVVSLLVFFLTQALPGDVVRQILGQNATDAQVAQLRAELGLDQPLAVQYVHWIGGLLSGDLGTSLTSGTPVSTLIGTRLEATLTLLAITALVMVPLAFALGIAAARRPGSITDHTISGGTLVVLALPEFVVAIALVALLATNAAQLLPPTSIVPGGGTVWQEPTVLVLPILTLVITAMPYLVESVKTAMRDELGSEHVRWALLMGVGERRVLLHHALRTAVTPSVQVAAMSLAYLLGGTVAVEVVFAYPGIGSALVTAVENRDVPVVQAIAMFIATASLVVYLAADILALVTNPRARRRAA